MHVGKFLNGYGRDAPPTRCRPVRRLERLRRPLDLQLLRLHGRRERRRCAPRPGPCFTRPTSSPSRADDLIAAAAPAASPWFMSVAFLAPHAGRPARARRPARPPTPAVPPAYANVFATLPLPVPPSFNEADVSDKPAGCAPAAARPGAIAAIREAYQPAARVLLAVDDGVASILARLQATGELDDTLILFTSDNGFFHGEHRVPDGKVLVYEPSIRLPLLMRGPGVPRGAKPAPARDQRRPRADDPRRRERPPGRAQDGRSLLRPGARPRVSSGAASCCSRRARRRRAWPPRPAQLPLQVRRVRRPASPSCTTSERDPDELSSLHARPALARLRARLAARLHALRACAGAGCRAKPALRLRGAPARCRRRHLRARPRRARRRGGQVLGPRRPRSVARDGAAPVHAHGQAARATGRRYLLRATVRLDDGRVVTLDRRGRGGCAA